ncbi:MAG: sulfite exporter TauE/SafE family protein [Alphaproteobacteria bacterium]|nr:sulfite exporter TauE/SafE family protein [Alphaproteobacteria bacterium]
MPDRIADVLDLATRSPATAAAVTAALLVAAIVRGYSGFGFSMLAVSGLSLALPPAAAIPVVLTLEVAASLHMLPGVWRQVDWRSLRPLVAGTVVATPVGVHLLATLPETSIRLAIAALVTTATLLLWRGFALKRMPGTGTTVATGAAAGLLNGSLGIGGPPVILFYLSSPAGTAAARASLVAYFLVTDAYAIAVGATEGLVSATTFLAALALLPILLIGVAIGSRGYIKTEPATFRRAVLILLLALSVAGVARALA